MIQYLYINIKIISMEENDKILFINEIREKYKEEIKEKINDWEDFNVDLNTPFFKLKWMDDIIRYLRWLWVMVDWKITFKKYFIFASCVKRLPVWWYELKDIIDIHKQLLKLEIPVKDLLYYPYNMAEYLREEYYIFEEDYILQIYAIFFSKNKEAIDILIDIANTGTNNIHIFFNEISWEVTHNWNIIWTIPVWSHQFKLFKFLLDNVRQVKTYEEIKNYISQERYSKSPDLFCHEQKDLLPTEIKKLILVKRWIWYWINNN